MRIERLESRTLFATGGGLLGTYHSNPDFSGATLARQDERITFNFGAAELAPGLGADTASVRWIGRVKPAYSETYTFKVISDDGAHLWVNGHLLFETFDAQSGLKVNSGRVNLHANRLYDIRLEYREGMGPASIQMRWRSASQYETIVPGAPVPARNARRRRAGGEVGRRDGPRAGEVQADAGRLGRQHRPLPRDYRRRLRAWLLYSLVNAYAETGRADFIEAAERVADYWLARVGADMVPNWDFDAPPSAGAFKDSSAAAVAASALLKLATAIAGTHDGLALPRRGRSDAVVTGVGQLPQHGRQPRPAPARRQVGRQRQRRRFADLRGLLLPGSDQPLQRFTVARGRRL